MLRPVEETDLPFLLRLYTVDGLPFAGLPDLSLDALRERWTRDRHRSDTDGKLIVVHAGEPAGVVSWTAREYFSTPQSRCWNIGIILTREYRGRGIGSLAQRELTDWLFATTDAHRVEAGADVDNLAERRALVAAGFVEEGVLRTAQFRDGAWHDVALYSRVR